MAWLYKQSLRCIFCGLQVLVYLDISSAPGHVSVYAVWLGG